MQILGVRIRHGLIHAILASIIAITGLAFLLLAKPALDLPISTAPSALAAPCPVAMINSGFESPSLFPLTWGDLPETSVPGWDTSAPDGLIEIWRNGFQPAHNAYEGEQFVELNANFASTLSQTVPLNPLFAGQTFSYAFAHKGRQGNDTARLLITVQPSGTTLINRQVTDGASTWGYYTGTFTPPAGTTSITYNFTAVSSSGGVTTVGNFLDAITITPPSCSTDVAVTKTVSPNPYLPGQPINFQVTVTNTGVFDPANPVAFVDNVPTGITGVTWTCTATGTGSSCGSLASGSGNNINGSITVPVGATITFNISGTAPPVATAPTSLANTATATVTGNIADSNTANNTATATATRQTNADLSVTKTVTQNPYAPGGPINYTIVARNNGPFPALSSAFVDNIPASITGTTWTCGTATGGATCGTLAAGGSGNSINGTINLPANSSVTFAVNGVAAQSGPTTISNTATISVPSGVTDPTTTNNSSTAVTTRGTTGLTIDKTTATTTLVAGQTITYSFIVTNTGTLPLTGVTVTDPLPGLSAINCPSTSLAAGANMTCTATYTVTQTDVNNGVRSNTATVTGTPPGTSTPPTASDTNTINGTRTATLTMTKSANPSSGVVAGNIVTYSFLVANTGNVTVSGITVTDPLPGISAINCPQTTLAPGTSTTCTATYTVTQANVNAGSISNTATVTGTPPSGVTAPTATSSTTVTTNRTATLTIDKTSPTTTLVAGQTVNYSFIVTNTGTVTLTNVNVTDPLTGLSAIDCNGATAGTGNPIPTLQPGTPTTCTATYVVTQTDVNNGVRSNTASITGTPPSGMTAPTAQDTNTINGTRTSTLTMTKSANPSSGVVAGTVVTYSFLVTNTGNVTVTGLNISDPLTGLSAINCPTTTLTPGQSTTCTATRTVTQSDVNTGTINNTATATAVPPSGVTAPSVQSSATVTANRTATLSLDKNTATTTLVANQTINYSFIVTNTGTVTLSNIAVTDPLSGMSAINCPVTTLNPGQSTTCTATYTVTQANVNNGTLTNTASVTGTPPAGMTAPTAQDTNTINGTRTPGINVVKSANPNNGVAAGNIVTYSFVVTNTGNVTLTGVNVTDPLPGLSAVSCPQTTLAPGASTTCTATYTVTQTNVNNGSFTNTATATGTPPAGTTAPTATSSTTVTTNRTATITIDKTTPTTTLVAGQTVNYSFIVTNTGTVTLTNVNVTDPLTGLSAIDCNGATAGTGNPIPTLQPNGTATCTATYVVTQANVNAGSLTNTASVTGTPPSGMTAPTASDINTINGTRTATLTMTKSANPSSGVVTGTVVTYSFLVTNTGNVTVTGVNVTDPMAGLSAINCPQTTLAPGASTTCTATYTVTQANVNAGSFSNTATATGTPPSGVTAPSVTSSATVTANRTATISIDKNSTTTTLVAGQTVPYTFTVTNTGTVTLTGITVTDPLTGMSAINCPTTTLNAGQSTTCTATYVVTQANVNNGTLTNTASVTGTPPVGMTAPNASDAHTINGTRTPGINVVKSASPNNGVRANDIVTYSFMVTNTGNVTLTGVNVTDPMVGLSAVSCPQTTLAPGASTTCTATYTVTQTNVNTGPFTNTATATGTPPTGTTAPTANSSTTVTPNRTATLSIVKSSNAGATLTLNQVITYSFLVTNTGTVTLNDVVVTDPLSGLSAINCPQTTLQPNQSTTCTATYTVTQADVDRGSITNTATATATPPAGMTPPTAQDTEVTSGPRTAALTMTKSASPSSGVVAGTVVTYSFLVTNTGNVTLTSLTVSDTDLPGLSAISCPQTTLAPGASTTCTATYTVTQSNVNNGAFSNTANVSAAPPDGVTAPNATSTTTVTPNRTAALSIDKNSTTTTLVAGQTIPYTFRVQNTGTVTISNLAVTDTDLPGLSAINCAGVTTLQPGQVITCTASYVVTQDDVDRGFITNTASATGTPPSGVTTPTASDVHTINGSQTPDLTLTKTASPNNGLTVGQTVTYTFTLNNPGNVTISNIAVTDPLTGLSAINCQSTGTPNVASLAPGATATCTATYTVTQTDVDSGTAPTWTLANTATAEGTAPGGVEINRTGGTTISGPHTNAVTLNKTASFVAPLQAGTIVTYTLTVTNTGTTTLSSASLVDTKYPTNQIDCDSGTGGVQALPTTLNPGQTVTCTLIHAVTQTEIDTNDLTNTATVSAQSPEGTPVTATESETLAFTETRSLTVEKTHTTSGANQVGVFTINYTFTVRNTGTVTIVPQLPNDPLLGPGGVTCPSPAYDQLAPGEAVDCTGTYVPSQADFDTKSAINNTVTVDSTTLAGNQPVPQATDSDTTPLNRTATLSVEKTRTSPDGVVADDVVTYSFLVTNTGNTTLTNIQLSDTITGAGAGAVITCPAPGSGAAYPSLAPGDSVTCTGQYVVTQQDLNSNGNDNDGTIDNVVTVTADAPNGLTDPSTQDTESVSVNNTPGVQVTKTALDVPAGGFVAGDVIHYEFDVENTGTVTLTDITLTDILPGISAITCDTTTLAPGDIATCEATYEVQQSDVDAGPTLSNTVTVTATAPDGSDITDTDTEDVPLDHTATLSIDKQADYPAGTLLIAGTTYNYIFIITNTGTTTLDDVTLTDSTISLTGLTCILPATGASVTLPYDGLLPGVTIRCEVPYTITQADVDGEIKSNTATVTATAPAGLPNPSAQDTVLLPQDAFSGLSVAKTPSKMSGLLLGETVTYTIEVRNTGTVTLSNVTVTEALPGASVPNCAGSGSNIIPTLAPFTPRVFCTVTYEVTQADVDAGSIVNNVTVTAEAPGTTPDPDPATATATVTTLREAELSLVKTADPAQNPTAGSTLTYSFLVTNTGTVTLTDVAVTENLPNVSELDCDPLTAGNQPTIPTLAPNGGDVTCTATYVVTQADVNAGSIVNDASVTGTPPAGVTAPTAEDDVTVTIERTPSISIVKSADPADGAGLGVGDSITYSFLIENTGNVTLTNVTPTDDLAGISPFDCDPATAGNQTSIPTLAPGADVTCTATYVVTQGDVDAGEVINDAVVNGTTPPGAPTLPTTPSNEVTVPLAQTPAMTLLKEADPADGAGIGLGDTITYTFTVTNTGDVTLNDVTIADDLAGVTVVTCEIGGANVAYPIDGFAPGAVATCTATYTVTQADLDAGEVVNNATASGIPPVGGPISSDPASVTVPLAQTSALSLTKSADPADGAGLGVGDTISYTILVENTGDVTLTNVTITDPLLPDPTAIDCDPATAGNQSVIASLAPDGQVTCTATYEVTQDDVNAGEVVNTAVGNATPPPGAPALPETPSNEVTVPLAQTPAISITKSADPADGAGVGVNDTITYSFLIENTGNVTLTNVTPTDDLAGLSAIDCDAATAGNQPVIATLEPGDDVTCTATYLVTQADVDAGEVVNDAVVNGTTPPGAPTLPETPSNEVTVPLAQAPAMTLVKEADPADGEGIGEGDIITFTFTATNTGDVTLDQVQIADQLAGMSALTCEIGGVTVTQPVDNFGPGAVLECEATYVVTQNDVDAAEVVNNATLTATPPPGTTLEPVPASVTVPLEQNPSLFMSKSGSLAEPDPQVEGNAILFTFLEVTNNGDVTMYNVSIVDSLLGPGVIDCDPNTAGIQSEIPSIPAGQTVTCRAEYLITQADINSGNVHNEAHATGYTPDLTTQIDSPTASVDVGINRFPGLSLTKSADPADGVGLGEGDTITYSVEVENTGNVTLTDVTITDPVLPDPASLDCGTGSNVILSLAPTAIITCTVEYTVTQEDVDAGQVVNTAVGNATTPAGGPTLPETPSNEVTVPLARTPAITLDKTGVLETAGAPTQVGDIITYTFTATNTGDVTLDDVEIVDPLTGLTALTCEVDGVAATQPVDGFAPGSVLECTATYAVTQTDIDAGDVDNQATVTATPPTGTTLDPVDSPEVTVPLEQNPAMTLVKTADPADGAGLGVGDIITYNFVLTNTGNVTITSATITETLPVSPLDCTLDGAPATLAVPTFDPGSVIECSATYTVTQTDVNNGEVENDASGTGTAPDNTPVPPADSSITVPLDNTPSMTIEKVSLGVPADGVVAGSIITYQFTVTNTGQVTIQNLVITDTKLGAGATIDCDRTTLNTGEIATCTAEYTVTQTDVDAGPQLHNDATATGSTPGGTPVEETDGNDTPVRQTAGLTVDKEAVYPPGTPLVAGTTITYTFQIENTGTTTLDDVTLSDPTTPLTGIVCTLESTGATVTLPYDGLAPGDAINCEVDYTLTQADVNGVTRSNTATVTATPPEGVTPPSGEDTVELPQDATAALEVEKVADPASGVDVDDVITYTITVQNTGTVTLTDVTVIEGLANASTPDCGAGSNVIPTLDPGAANAVECTVTYTVTQADVDAGEITNDVTVTGTPPANVPAPEEATTSVTVETLQAPGISITKSADPADGAGVGVNDTITYSFLIENTGNVTLTNVTPTDDLAGLSAIDCDAATAGNQPVIATLAPDDDVTCTATYLVTQADVDAGEVVNDAVVNGTTPPGAPTLPETPSNQVTVPLAQNPSILIEKSADPADGAGIGLGDTITYLFHIENTGDVTLTNVTPSDDLVGLSAIDCDPNTDGDQTSIPTLAPGAQVNCAATYVVTQADVDAGQVVNDAVVNGTTPPGAPTLPETPSNEVTVPLARDPELTLAKTSDPVEGTQNLTVGQVVSYTFVATNTGDVTLDDVQITDGLAGLTALTCEIGGVAVTQPVDNFGPGAVLECTATYEVTQTDLNNGQLVNTASVTATPPTGTTLDPVTDTNTITIPRTPALSLVKSADPADGAGIGLNDIITYTMVVENTGNVTLTNVTITDPLLPSSAAIDCVAGTNVIPTMAPDDQITCTVEYVVTQDDVDAGQVVNTALANGTPPPGAPILPETPSNQVTVPLERNPAITFEKEADPANGAGIGLGDTITYTFTATNTGDVTLDDVNITDSLPGISVLTCEVDGIAATQPVNDFAPESVLECTATYEVTQEDIDAGEVINNALVTADPPNGLTLDPVPDTVTVPLAQTPAISIIKSADPADGAGVGINDTITYTFLIENTGNVTLTGVAPTDPLIGMSAIDCDPISTGAQSVIGTLAPDDQITCTSTYMVTQDDMNAGQVANQAFVNGTTPPGAPTLPQTPSNPVIVPLERTPELTLTKTADPADGAGLVLGSTISYTFVATNSGDVTLNDVEITDPLTGLTALSCEIGGVPIAQPVDSFGPGAVLECTATYVVTQSDLNNGEVVNQATVTATPPAGTTLDPVDSPEVTVPLAQVSDIEIVKGSTYNGATTGAEVGDTISYTFDVTNTGNVTLTNVTVTDDLPNLSAIDCGAGTNVIATLEPGAANTVQCTATYTLTQDDIDAGEVVNQAVVNGTTPPGAPALPETPSEEVTTELPQAPALEILKAGTYTGDLDRAEVGDTIEYTFEVTNTGNVTLTDVTISDDLAGLSAIDCEAGSNVIATLERGDENTVTCTASYTITQDDIDAGEVVNQATGNADTPPGAPELPETSSNEEVTELVRTAGLTIEKTAEPVSGVVTDDVITYTMTVENTGNVTLTDVTVTDTLPNISAVDCGDGTNVIPTLEPGAANAVECTATYTVTQADVNSGNIQNSASASGIPPEGVEPPVVTPSSVNVSTNRTSGLTIVKTADPTSGVVADDVITYTFLLENTGTVTLTDVTVTDELANLSAVDCGDGTNVIPTLEPGAANSVQCSATYTVTQGDVNNGSVQNSASASGTPPEGVEPPVVTPSVVNVPTSQEASLAIVKTADPDSGVMLNDVITYTIVVENTGTVTLTDVTVTDALPDLVWVDDPIIGTLEPGETATITATYTVTQDDVENGDVSNSASVTGTPPEGVEPPASPSSEVTVPAGIQPGISITKTAEPASDVNTGDVITYTFLIENTGNVSLQNVTVTDELAGLEWVTGPNVGTLATGESTTATATYTVTQEDVNNGGVTNSATATGTPPGGQTPPVSEPSEVTVPTTVGPALEVSKTADPASGVSAGDTITFSFVVTNTGNVTLDEVTVNDDMDGLTWVEGPNVGTLEPGESATATATYVVTEQDVANGGVTNSATATGIGPDGEPIEAPETEVVVPISDPGMLSLQKSASAAEGQIVDTGDTVTYRFEITNTGGSALTDITLTDPMPGLTNWRLLPNETPLQAIDGDTVYVTGSLGPGETLVVEADYTVTSNDVANGSISNEASVSGTDQEGNTVRDTGSTVIAACAVPPTPTPTEEPSDDATPIVEGETEVPVDTVGGQTLDPTNTPEPGETRCAPIVQPTELPNTPEPTRDPGGPGTDDGTGDGGGGNDDGGGGGGGNATPVSELPNTGQGTGGQSPLGTVLLTLATLIALAAAGMTIRTARQRRSTE